MTGRKPNERDEGYTVLERCIKSECKEKIRNRG
jgi:hypothetical protein